MKLTALLLASALLSAPVAAAAAPPPVDLDAVRRIVSDPKGAAAPGCVVGAFKAGKTLFVTAAGSADIEKGTPLDGDTLIYAASVSKQFTSLAAAMLATQGKIDLDADIRTYLPELPQYEVPVTARMLMHHTAGIRDSLTLLRLAGLAGSNESNKAQALDLLFRQKGTNFTPGTDWTYSNGGYLLLAEIVERVSGKPFADYVNAAILKPLGMKSSFFMNDAEPVGKIAHGYNPKDGGFVIRDTYPRFSGSGGLMVSINDLAKFDQDIEIGHKVWTPAVQAIMLKPGTFTNGQPAGRKMGSQAYAGGLMVGQRRGQYFVEHGGGAEAFRNQYERLPERRLGVAVFCNRGDWNPVAKADEVIALLEGNILAAEAKPNLAGRYVSPELQATYDLTVDGAKLTAAVSSPYTKSGEPLVFQRGGDGVFRSDEGSLTFDDDGKGFTLTTGRVTAIHFARGN
ncbi:serine hydrolase domain-containing protein [Sphingomonas colocasiae]|uniref:Beta-lactamase family protein n=1 Tax=Sphingomonas colocasiae TaxID=1848973 RepID=A0ABS7PRH4_9SPHN|nr:serine hydrolase domain-containing protein [Sphingomonas colocasiae]MBY8823873.1 beta-lactamase family protein [Sphingomonas colocasiae]